jgi:hypothetical protein
MRFSTEDFFSATSLILLVYAPLFCTRTLRVVQKIYYVTQFKLEFLIIHTQY